MITGSSGISGAEHASSVFASRDSGSHSRQDKIRDASDLELTYARRFNQSKILPDETGARRSIAEIMRASEPTSTRD